MQRNSTARSSCAPEIPSAPPAALPPATPPETITKTITNRQNVIGFPIGRLATLAAALAVFGTLVYFVPMIALALTCSIVLYLANTFVDSQFNRRSGR